MVHPHTVHLPLGALLIWCTMCGTGGHECMLSQALSAHQRSTFGPKRDLRVRYVPEVRCSPTLLRLSDADDSQCVGVQHAYMCSEKRKVRSQGGGGAGGGAGATAASAAAKRCKQLDRRRKQIHVRVRFNESLENQTVAEAARTAEQARGQGARRTRLI